MGAGTEKPKELDDEFYKKLNPILDKISDTNDTDNNNNELHALCVKYNNIVPSSVTKNG